MSGCASPPEHKWKRLYWWTTLLQVCTQCDLCRARIPMRVRDKWFASYTRHEWKEFRPPFDGSTYFRVKK